ncbi:MAG: MerR family transcriptional regulator [Lachnospiraceae bacterium]|nr:MerR family transcriptional regulator [Lachnospiraceae bacterium]
MQIKEVEALAGITKKNIRFYEKEGLLKPKRNAGNDYREYSREDVVTLKKIKLLRKLDVSLGEIRILLTEQVSLEYVLNRHIRELESRKKNVEEAKSLCERLVEQRDTLANLDAELYLEQMEKMEKEGIAFMGFQEKDRLKRYAGAAIAAGIVLLMIVLMEISLVVAMSIGDAPWYMVLLGGGIFAAVGISIAISLVLRVIEIKGGEEDAARKY